MEIYSSNEKTHHSGELVTLMKFHDSDEILDANMWSWWTFMFGLESVSIRGGGKFWMCLNYPDKGYPKPAF